MALLIFPLLMASLAAPAAMPETPVGWRVDDLIYEDGRTLRRLLGH